MPPQSHPFLVIPLLLLFGTFAQAQTPGPPTGLSATPNEDRTVTLQWSAPSSGGTPTGYRVEGGTSSGASDTFGDTVGAVTTFRTGALTVGTTYYFRVRAFNGSGVSTASNEVSLTIQCPPPSAPQHVSWRPVGSDLLVVWVGTGQVVEFGSSPGENNVLTAMPTPGQNRNAVQVTLQPGSYYARVVNQSSCSPARAASPDIVVTSGEPYGSAELLINELGGQDHARVRFIELKNIGTNPINIGNWKLLSGLRTVYHVTGLPAGTMLPPGCTYLVGTTIYGNLVPAPDISVYEIFSFSAALVDPTGRIRDSVAADEDDDGGIPYVFAEGTRTRSIASPASIARVADTDTNNNDADFVWLAQATPQNSSSCSIGGAPPGPSPLLATVNAGTVTLDWTLISMTPPVTQYSLEVGLIAGATHFGPFPFPADQSSVTFSGVPDGTYYARMRATNANGTSPPTNEVTLVVCWQNCTLLPGAVTQLTFQQSGSTVLLAWNPPTSGGAVTGYVIEGGTTSGLSNLGQYPTGSMVPFVIVSGVPPGTYFVRVRAANGGVLGPPSNEVVIVVP